MRAAGHFFRGVVLLGLTTLHACGGNSSTPSALDKQLEVPQPAPPSVPAVQAPDPLLPFQWHLINSLGVDLNVEPVWNNGLSGRGVLIAIVDDGIEMTHEDLQPNLSPSASHVYNGQPGSPSTEPSMNHGTAVAGLVAALRQNGKGGSGVAPAATLANYALTDNPTDLNIENAMRRDPAVAISNNSWSEDPDKTGELYSPSLLWKQAIDKGVKTGRDGLGTVYVWAAGNGGVPDGDPVVDNSNYDGMANARQVLAICAVGDRGKRASYSEHGANLWICAPSWQGEQATRMVTTTDRTATPGYNAGTSPDDYPDASYTNSFAGTSASAPLASGSIALMLQANPLLNWRDIRLILAQTAVKNDPRDADWTETGGTPKYHVNHKYGFGLLDVGAAVTAAKTWVSVAAERVTDNKTATPNIAIPDSNLAGVTSTIQIDDDLSIEFIEVTFSALHKYHGELTVNLISPTKTKSILAQAHGCFKESATGIPKAIPCTSKYDSWVFGVARHLGETAKGIWTLQVADELKDDVGTFQSWSVKFYGH